jgi:hypothetical protein
VSDHPHRRRRTHKSKSVSTSAEILIHRVLIAGFILATVALAAYLTMVASRR